MCLIALAPKGTQKTSEKLLNAIRTAAKTNDDGMGYAFKRNGTRKIYITKGYKTVEGMIKSIKTRRLKEDDELMVHLRIGNKGAKNTDMCHPFVVSPKKGVILSNDEFVKEPVMVHNGTFYLYSKINSEFSDTYWCIQEFLSHPTIIHMMKEDFEFFKKVFETKITTNRIGLLFPDRDMKYTGEFIEDEGYLFSNASYRDYRIRNVGGVETFEERKEKFHEALDRHKMMNELNRSRYFGTSRHFENNCTDEDDEDYAVSLGFSCSGGMAVVSGNESTNSKIRKPTLEELMPLTNANPLTELVVLPCENPERYDDDFTQLTYRRYMDMWVPMAHREPTQFDAINFIPSEFNYNDFQFQAKKDDADMGVKKGMFYTITSFGTGQDPLHCLTRMYGKYSLDFVYVDGGRLHEVFQCIPTAKTFCKYRDFYRLAKVCRPSKTSLKRLTHLLNNKAQDEKVKFRGLESLDRDAVRLYASIMFREIYPDDYQKQINHKMVN